MTDSEKACRAIGWLEGFSAWIWAHADKDLAGEACAYYDEQVETLRKALSATSTDDWEDCK